MRRCDVALSNTANGFEPGKFTLAVTFATTVPTLTIAWPLAVMFPVVGDMENGVGIAQVDLEAEGYGEGGEGRAADGELHSLGLMAVDGEAGAVGAAIAHGGEHGGEVGAELWL